MYLIIIYESMKHMYNSQYNFSNFSNFEINKNSKMQFVNIVYS